MKSFFKKTLIIPVSVLCASSLFSCSSSNETNEEESNNLKFVVATSNTFDEAITVGSYKYQIDVNFEKDNKLTFNAECKEKVENNQGGGGFPGFGQFASDESSEEESSETEDLSEHNISFSGTYELETGYGYKLSFADEAKTIIHTDFDVITGRHQFYYSFKTSDASKTILFQAKDSDFRKTLASDYKTWDERDSKYIFTGKTTGNNNSVALAYLYLHNDGSVVYNTANGADREVTLGLIYEESNDVISIIDGNNVSKSDSSINSDHPGYRLNYDGNTFFCTTKSGLSWSDLTNEDFDGQTLYQFSGSYTTTGPDGSTKEVVLNLTNNNNKMYLYSAGSLSKTGTYTFANDVFTLTFEGEEPVTIEAVDGVYTYSFKIVVSSFFGSSEIDVTLTYSK